ncbi:MAG: DNA primase [Rubrivivax sp.]
MARGQIPDSFVQDVLARTDIVEVVGRHVELRRGGANLLGLCPFHGEKSPSFTVSPAKQFYHCFGCGAHGDALRFLMEHTGVGFLDGLEDLAQRLGLQVPKAEVDPRQAALDAQSRAQRQTLTEILERAAAHYRQRLRESPRAIDYLKKRGLSGQVARDFGLGYAPEGWRALASAFAQYDAPEIADAGLVIVQDGQGEQARRYDRFRDRIMFPIRSVKGEVIGFGGRVLDQGEPKYLNSPETPIFVKGRELYGLFEARTAIREQGYVLVVEGYMDVVALAQYGIGHAVATLGTACTADHVHKLLRFTDHVVFSFDGDAAGRRAAGRALEAALPHVNDLRTFRFLFLPPEHDPDSYVRAHGRDAFTALARSATPLSRQLLDHAAQGQTLDTAEARAAMLARAKPLWQQMPVSAMRVQLLGELAQAARISGDELARMWGERRQEGRGAGPAARRQIHAAPMARRVRQPPDQVARMLLRDASLWNALTEADHELLTRLDTWHGEMFRWLERDLTEHGPREWPELRTDIESQPFASQAWELVDNAEVSIPPDIEELRGALLQTARALALKEPLHLLGRAG